jgi:hypothetical protein
MEKQEQVLGAVTSDFAPLLVLGLPLPLCPLPAMLKLGVLCLVLQLQCLESLLLLVRYVPQQRLRQLSQQQWLLLLLLLLLWFVANPSAKAPTPHSVHCRRHVQA